MYHYTHLRNRFRWWNAAGLALVLLMNTLANVLPLGGVTTGEISDRYPVQITPAGYAFSIWSLIYALLLGYVIYQALPRHAGNTGVRAVGIWFLVSCVCNAAWIVLWHYEFLTASVFVMLVLLLSLIAIYRGVRFGGGKSIRPFAGEYLLLRLPFSVYLGWISVATIVNITVVLYAAGWDGFGLSGELWTMLLLGAGTLLAAVIGIAYRDPTYMLVFVWAFAAISIKQRDASPDVAAVALAAAALILLLAIAVLIRALRRG
ncbi:tryptophan-rich sensory protein [Paenibacillus sp. IB182496]|uniref:Tryptophan-rich sensory protein n=1 Tax=Paenibacillus sabuli TaxID=2772509 RepID=A0A927BP13_9BACL|nr:TspO/MBR family protein [Paenibacillus sabuli]MBD2844092.1 tryptophan-rich sensory protein [Paenibacillus sabuli]